MEVAHVLKRSVHVKKALSNHFIQTRSGTSHWELGLYGGRVRRTCLPSFTAEPWQERVGWQPGCFCSGCVVCFFCLELNLCGLIKVPLQHAALALDAGGPQLPQGNSQGRQKDSEEIRE